MQSAWIFLFQILWFRLKKLIKVITLKVLILHEVDGIK